MINVLWSQMNVSKYVAIFSFVFIQLISVGKVFAN
ncbi:TPA: lipid IV(A) palmitoyltransferase PagP, partial [Escherichia coli]|nr:lipid IV(A) palmitoyltransferase PagP [Escherichia coli]